MNEEIEDIDLSSYSVEQLSTLVEEAKKEIARKEKNRVLEVQDEIKRLANSLSMSVEQVLSFNAKNRQKKSAKTVGKIKYQNPADPEQTWTGRGKQPNWLKDALERGAKKEDFLIE